MRDQLQALVEKWRKAPRNQGRYWSAADELEALLAAQGAQLGPIELTPVNYDPVMARTHLLVPKDMKCHKCGAEEPWKDPRREDVAAALAEQERLNDPKTWEGIGDEPTARAAQKGATGVYAPVCSVCGKPPQPGEAWHEGHVKCKTALAAAAPVPLEPKVNIASAFVEQLCPLCQAAFTAASYADIRPPAAPAPLEELDTEAIAEQIAVVYASEIGHQRGDWINAWSVVRKELPKLLDSALSRMVKR